MPEGPEVRYVCDSLQVLAGKRVSSALVVSGRYKRGAIYDLQRLGGALLRHISCKGKLLVFHFDAGQVFYVLSTLGMSGWWVVLEKADHEWDKYRRIELVFEDGTVAAFFDPRNFGTFKVVEHAEMRRKLQELGPDIMTESDLWHAVALPEFRARLRRFGASSSIAEALLDQRIAAGCGNYIRADALFLTRLSPHTKANNLSSNQESMLWTNMNLIACHSFKDMHPLTPNEKFDTLVYGKEISFKGQEVSSFKDRDGRTVWWVPEEQR